MRIQFIINALYILTTFFCTFLHVCAHFGRLANSVREAFLIFALSEEGRPTGRLPQKMDLYDFYGPPRGEERRRGDGHPP